MKFIPFYYWKVLISILLQYDECFKIVEKFKIMKKYINNYGDNNNEMLENETIRKFRTKNVILCLSECSKNKRCNYSLLDGEFCILKIGWFLENDILEENNLTVGIKYQKSMDKHPKTECCDFIFF